MKLFIERSDNMGKLILSIIIVIADYALENQ